LEVGELAKEGGLGLTGEDGAEDGGGIGVGCLGSEVGSVASLTSWIIAERHEAMKSSVRGGSVDGWDDEGWRRRWWRRSVGS